MQNIALTQKKWIWGKPNNQLCFSFYTCKMREKNNSMAFNTPESNDCSKNC